MSDSNRFKLDPNIVKMAGDSKALNYGHAVSQMFKDLGDIKVQQKQEERADTENSYKQIQLQNIKDEIADDKKFAEFVANDNPEEYLKNNPFTTGKYTLQSKEFLEKNKNKFSEEQRKKHFEYATTYFTDDKGNFDINGAKNHLKTKFENGEIDADTYHNVADSIYQKAKYGIYADKEKKKSLSISDQIKLQEYAQNKKTEVTLENDLMNIRENYKKLFGKDMTAAQEIAYKKKGELPYMEYGTKNLPEKRKQLIDANILIEKALSRLDKYSLKDVQEVAGSIQGEDIAMLVREKTGNLTPKEKEIATILGYVNSEKMHELYGAALTGGEIGRARRWNLDINQGADLLLTALNELRTKNKESLEHNSQGVYGVPSDGLTFKMFDVSGKEKKDNTQKTMSREEKIKFLQGN